MTDQSIASSPIAVLGAGSWGTALAIQLARNSNEVRLWGRSPDHIEELSASGENQRYLPGCPLPPNIKPEANLEKALLNVRDILVVVPSHALREIFPILKVLMHPEARIGLATKGFEPETGCLPNQLAEEILGGAVPVAVVSGPTFAAEVGRGLPTGVTVASENVTFADALAGRLHDGRFRAYTSSDVVGVEVGGAVKNVMAIAAGCADGLGFGANTRAALITRGLAEIIQLGRALGGDRETFLGLAGLGDLVLTCTDDLSRNRRMGLALARGQTIAQAAEEIGQVVEGVRAAKAVWQVARKYGVEMRITEQVYRVLYEAVPPLEAVENLMSGGPKAETAVFSQHP